MSTLVLLLYFTHLQLALQCFREEAVTAWQLAAHQDNSSTRPMWTRESKTKIKMVKNYWAGINKYIILMNFCWQYLWELMRMVKKYYFFTTLEWLAVIPAGLHLSVDCRRDCSSGAAVTGELQGLAQLGAGTPVHWPRESPIMVEQWHWPMSTLRLAGWTVTCVIITVTPLLPILISNSHIMTTHRWHR